MKSAPSSKSKTEIRRSIRRALLRWFRLHPRPMPWRSTHDPYRIWLAEILLQQTRVRSALPYYRKFLERFPDMESLARAPFRDVLRAWSGLGYYARARNLHAAAGEILRRFDGRIPDTRTALLALPGIGPYTASALLSFIHGKREGVVDGNVARVLTRLFLVPGNPRSGPVLERLRGIADDLVPARRSRDFNLAMIDIGAAICRPRAPRCPECPLAAHCRARAEDLRERYPEIPPRRKTERVGRLVAVMHRADRLFLVRRPEKGLLGGMWEFPGYDSRAGARGAGRLSRELTRRWKIPVRAAGEPAVAEHSITYRSIRVHAFRATIPANAEIPGGEWIRGRDLARYPITTATRKILERKKS